MKPNFALSLSMEGIVLLHRAAGGWRRVGAVDLGNPDLPSALSDLRGKAGLLEPGDVSAKVIIPNDQIRYLSVDLADVDPLFRDRMLMQALDEATPYALDELAFDMAEDGETTHIAAVALETLAEAEAFAAENGFNPVSFVAIPGDQPFLGEPFFGPSSQLGDGQIEPDGIAVVEIGPAEFPEEVIEEEDEPESEPDGPGTEEPEAPQAEPAPVAPAPGFSSRRGKPRPDEKKAASEEPVRPTTDTPTDQPPVAAPAVQVEGSSAPDAASAPAPTPEPIAPDPSPKPVDHGAVPALGPAGGAAETATGGFSSRRTAPPAPRAEPVTPKPTIPHQIAEPPPQPEPTSAQAAHDESSRMTVFGARKPPKVGGKPKYLGVILTALLILGLLAAAAFATLGEPGLVSRLFGRAPTVVQDAPPAPDVAEPDEVAPTPEPDAPVVDGPTPQSEPTPLPDPLISSLPAPVAVPSASSLSSTDTAVLDALRDDEPDTSVETDPQLAHVDPEQLSDGALSPGATLELEDEAPQADALDNSAALYAATGIWSTAPDQPATPGTIGLDDLYIASIDRTDLSQDAVALPPVHTEDSDVALPTVSNPAAAGTVFNLDEDGLVEATPEGTLNPDGVMVYLGRPPIAPPETPEREADLPEAEAEEANERLAGLRPKARPDDLSEQAERAQLGGLSRSELAGVRPKLRPQSIQQQAEAQQQNETEPSDAKLRLAASKTPRLRPSNIAQIAERARKNEQNNVPSLATASASTAAVVAAPVATVTPKIPTSTSVARQATIDNALNLRRVNLIGVYGTPSDRRALVRLPSGTYRKVKVGDRVDGGKVVAIGDSELRYQKSGRNLTLRIPNG